MFLSFCSSSFAIYAGDAERNDQLERFLPGTVIPIVSSILGEGVTKLREKNVSVRGNAVSVEK